MKKILLVCTGNTCRSPMAQTILQQMLDSKARGMFRVYSAGIAAADGAPASWPAVKAVNDSGHDLSRHRSRSVDGQMITDTDLVLTMTRYHCRILLERYPHAAAKIFTLGEYAGDSHLEVSDPLGGSLAEYKQCKQELEELLAEVSARLLEQ